MSTKAEIQARMADLKATMDAVDDEAIKADFAVEYADLRNKLIALVTATSAAKPDPPPTPAAVTEPKKSRVKIRQTTLAALASRKEPADAVPDAAPESEPVPAPKSGGKVKPKKADKMATDDVAEKDPPKKKRANSQSKKKDVVVVVPPHLVPAADWDGKEEYLDVLRRAKDSKTVRDFESVLKEVFSDGTLCRTTLVALAVAHAHLDANKVAFAVAAAKACEQKNFLGPDLFSCENLGEKGVLEAKLSAEEADYKAAHPDDDKDWLAIGVSLHLRSKFTTPILAEHLLPRMLAGAAPLTVGMCVYKPEGKGSTACEALTPPKGALHAPSLCRAALKSLSFVGADKDGRTLVDPLAYGMMLLDMAKSANRARQKAGTEELKLKELAAAAYGGDAMYISVYLKSEFGTSYGKDDFEFSVGPSFEIFSKTPRAVRATQKRAIAANKSAPIDSLDPFRDGEAAGPANGADGGSKRGRGGRAKSEPRIPLRLIPSLFVYDKSDDAVGRLLPLFDALAMQTSEGRTYETWQDALDGINISTRQTSTSLPTKSAAAKKKKKTADDDQMDEDEDDEDEDDEEDDADGGGPGTFRKGGKQLSEGAVTGKTVVNQTSARVPSMSRFLFNPPTTDKGAEATKLYAQMVATAKTFKSANFITTGAQLLGVMAELLDASKDISVTDFVRVAYTHGNFGDLLKLFVFTHRHEPAAVNADEQFYKSLRTSAGFAKYVAQVAAMSGAVHATYEFITTYGAPGSDESRTLQMLETARDALRTAGPIDLCKKFDLQA